MLDSVTIQWLGHACFKIIADDYSIVIDPYENGYVPGFGPLQTDAVQVISSHNHKDHGFTEAVTIRPFGGEIPFRIEVVESWHDDQQGELRGPNKIHLLDGGGIRLAHLGDLGCMLTKEQFDRIGTPDVLMIPVGGYYTIDAAAAKTIADRIGAKVTIPMHYRSPDFGFDVLDTLDIFTGFYTEGGPDICSYDTDRLTIDPDTKQQIAIFTQWNNN